MKIQIRISHGPQVCMEARSVRLSGQQWIRICTVRFYDWFMDSPVAVLLGALKAHSILLNIYRVTNGSQMTNTSRYLHGISLSPYRSCTLIWNFLHSSYNGWVFWYSLEGFFGALKTHSVLLSYYLQMKGSRMTDTGGFLHVISSAGISELDTARKFLTLTCVQRVVLSTCIWRRISW